MSATNSTTNSTTNSNVPAKKTLTTWQAACIITGYGVGSGIMSLPYLANMAGIVAAAAALALAFFFSYLLHMMLAEMALGAGAGNQVVNIFKKYLFRGKIGTKLLPILFVLIVIALCVNLAAYVAGGAEILEAAGVPHLLAEFIFYAIAAAVVFFGLKALGISESVSIIAIIAIIGTLSIASLFNLTNPLAFLPQSAAGVLAFFGMSVFAFTAIFSVPQVVEGLGGDRTKVRRAITAGLGINLAFIVVITLCVLASSQGGTITTLAMIGWSAGIGTWAQILGSAFTLVALMTTFWSISLGLTDILGEQLHWHRNLCWLCATLPAFLIAILASGGFMEALRLAASVISLLVAFIIMPAYRNCRRAEGKLLLGNVLGSTPFQLATMLAFVIAAIGSMVSI